MGRLVPILIMLVCGLCAPSFATDKQGEPIQSDFSMRWENDTICRTDENYTNGISIALSKVNTGLLGGVWDLGGAAAGSKSSVYEFTQLQFTPTDLKSSLLDSNDRSYAGLTYLACITHLQQEKSLQSLKLMLGIVGPDSGAEELQKYTHRLLHQNTPNGWHSQLKNEPVVNLLYEFRYRYRFTPGAGNVGVDFIPMGGAFFGNYLIQAQSEVMLRVGYHLPDDFGATSLRGIGYLPPPPIGSSVYKWGVNGYLRGGANLVARNMTLDGNTFDSSKSVEKRNFVPVVEVGTSLVTTMFLMTISYQVWGREFNLQKHSQGYSSILISIPL